MIDMVVKLGGSLLHDGQHRAHALDAIAAAHHAGVRLIIVHGGGKHIDRAMSERGLQKKTINGLRVTGDAAIGVVVSTLAGTVSSMIVRELRRRDIAAAGISGADASLVTATLHPPVNGTDLGHVGLVQHVDPRLPILLCEGAILPVVACLAADSSGSPLNVNGDTVASAIAVAVSARRLVYLTDVEGFLDERGEVVETLSLAQSRLLLERGGVDGGMRPKLESIVAALENGVSEALIAGPSRHASALIHGEGGTRLAAA